MERVVLILGIIVLVIAVFKHFKWPSITAYLLIGCFFGPYGLGLLEHSEQINKIAEMGIVFLLFTIGLELPLSRLFMMRYNLLLLGGLQVFICTALVTLFIYLIINNFVNSFIIASAISLSSTAIIMRQLSEQNELFSGHGELAFAMLIFQDIAVVPLLIILPVISGNDYNFSFQHIELILPIITVLVKGIIVFIIIIAISKFILKGFLHAVALTRSLELFMFSVLFIALLSAFITQQFGLSMTFGAFIAGIGLGGSEYRHQIDVELRPFRDILLGLFFVTIGMLLNTRVIIDNYYYVILVVLAIVLVKFFVIALLCYLLGKKVNLESALKTGMIMAHVGEFGLAILTLTMSYKIIDNEQGQIILSAMIVSLFIAVILTKYMNNIIKILHIFKPNKDLKNSYFKNKENKKNQAAPIQVHYPEYNDHIIICGFGRVGTTIAKFLRIENKPYLAIEFNPDLVKQGVLDGYHVYYGDATRRDILAYSSLKHARLVAICTDNDSIAKNIITNIRSLNHDISILVRTKDLRNHDLLLKAGANKVVAETFEVSMMLILNVLLMSGIRVDDALEYVNNWRDPGSSYI